jgi:hypothetical protein
VNHPVIIYDNKLKDVSIEIVLVSKILKYNIEKINPTLKRFLEQNGNTAQPRRKHIKR